MNWAALHWREPIWLLFTVLPWLLWLGQRLWQRQQQSQYADPALWPWVKVSTAEHLAKNWTQRLLWGVKKLSSPIAFLTVAWLAWMIALAGPRTIQSSVQQQQRNGVDILVVMDLSRSMEAKDVLPNRFEFAKAWVSAINQQLAPADRIGLLGYQAYPHLIVPLTQDKGLFAHFLQLTEPDMMPTRGSRLKTALVEAHRLLKQTAEQPTLLLVFTNGQPSAWQLQPDPDGYDRLQQDSIETYIYGVGTPKPVPLELDDPAQPHAYLHVNGLLVKTRLEEAFLRKVAEQVGGSYEKLSADHRQINQLLKRIAAKAKPQTLNEQTTQWQDHSLPFIALGILALMLAWFRIQVPIKLQHKSPPPLAGLGILTFFTLFSLGLSLISQPVMAAQLDWQQMRKAKLAYEAYQNKDYALATQYFDEVGGFLGWFNAGDAAYRNQDWASAVFYFRYAFQAANSDHERAQALYNLGNTYYQTRLYQKAIEAYQGALHYQAPYSKAQHNLKLAEKQLQKAQRNQPGKQKKGVGGGNNPQQEGAFYGGQKPSEKQKPGQGGEDQIETQAGPKAKFVLPKIEAPTEYGVQQGMSQTLEIGAEGSGLNPQAQAILQDEQQQKVIADIEGRLRQVKDKQRVLLKRIFEREEGYMAPQKVPHQMPGIQPW